MCHHRSLYLAEDKLRQHRTPLLNHYCFWLADVLTVESPLR